MPTSTVTSADHRNHAMARDISTGYTFTRTPGSSAFIEGVSTRLKKYKSRIQIIPKIKCSQRSAINSFAAAFARKVKCGFHSGNVASSHKPMREPPLKHSMHHGSALGVLSIPEARLGPRPWKLRIHCRH